ncbi:Serine/threonine protein kinase [Candidatus Sulfopaludibacter sp. SbA4]|nr:Serine/threonine protein kinase [Candidatus Sulfopaludibacter sp. SbA4]
MDLPARIGKYELEEFLGGGMSHVYRARDTVIGRTVAVKILTEEGCQDAEAKARFLAEARMAGNIAHDNVLSIYDFGEDERHRPFMVMEFLRGEDLRHALKNGHIGDLKSKLKIALQVARALEYVHTQKIIHRDIKPENVHITTNGVVKLMDFGIAKTEGLAMTRAGYVLGTPYYMAPEQVMGQEITEQVDVYAFGVLLFELMTGAKPFGGDSVERIFYSVLNEPVNPEPMLQSGAPQALCDLVTRCTQKSPAQRPQGFTPVCAELEKLLAVQDAPTMVMPAAAPPAPQRPPWLMPVLLLVVVALAAGLYFALQPKPAPKAVAVEKKGPDLPKTLSMASGDMVLVPAGPFLFGENKEKATLPAYYVDKTEVTNQAYAAFCSEKGYKLPKDFKAGKPDFPVVNVSILDAKAFATWAGKRLPNAREWEKAARGPEGLMFPWGNDPDPARANVGSPLGDHLRPVTDFPKGASPYGALNMVGNVWELVEELGQPKPETLDYFRTNKLLKYTPSPNETWYEMRGGSFNDQLSEIRIWDVAHIPAGWRLPNIGFRCVKDPQ